MYPRCNFNIFYQKDYFGNSENSQNSTCLNEILKNLDFRGFSLRHFGFDKRFGFTKEVTLDESYKDYFLDQTNFFWYIYVGDGCRIRRIVDKNSRNCHQHELGRPWRNSFLRIVGPTIIKNVVWVTKIFTVGHMIVTWHQMRSHDMFDYGIWSW